MSGVVLGFAPCWVHGDVFAFDPDTVVTLWLGPGPGDPAAFIAVPPGTPGARQVAICDPCLVTINAARVAAGMPPHRLAAEMPSAEPTP